MAMPKKIAEEKPNNSKRKVLSVEAGSAAEEGGVLPGDELIAVNGHKIKDVFDYRYYCADDYVELHMKDENGEEYVVDIEKEPYEDLGIEFTDPLLDNDRSCANNCIFCFIDQMPPGMRDTLYFKDDDIRLSFLTGNYVTLTNVTEQELKRVVKYRMSPINVSVHTLNPELRCKMLNHKGAGNVYEKIKILTEGGIIVNAQIVLCPGYNDGEELRSTLKGLLTLGEHLQSVSAVPVGLTKYRDGLAKLRPFTPEECGEIVDIIEEIQETALKERGTRFIYGADELYIKAGRELPGHECYDDFPQIENGVGMVSLLEQEVSEYLESDGFKTAVREASTALKGRCRKVTSAVGVCAFEIVKALVEKVCAACGENGLSVDGNAVMIKNDFFGENVTVSGLITGGDLINGLMGHDLGDEVLITKNMLRRGETVFLDNVTVSDVEKALGVKVRAVEDSGKDFVLSIIGGECNE